MGWRRRHKVLRGTFLNPAAAVTLCRQKGRRTPGEIYECAIGRMPEAANVKLWAKEARRLATAQGTFEGAKRRKRRK